MVEPFMFIEMEFFIDPLSLSGADLKELQRILAKIDPENGCAFSLTSPIELGVEMGVSPSASGPPELTVRADADGPLGVFELRADAGDLIALDGLVRGVEDYALDFGSRPVGAERFLRVNPESPIWAGLMERLERARPESTARGREMFARMYEVRADWSNNSGFPQPPLGWAAGAVARLAERAMADPCPLVEDFLALPAECVRL